MPARDRNLPASARGAERKPCSTLTADLQVSRFVNKQVLGFEVPVEDAVGVAVVQALDELIGEFLLFQRRSYNLSLDPHLPHRRNNSL
jgi:hypothetical protein